MLASLRRAVVPARPRVAAALTAKRNYGYSSVEVKTKEQVQEDVDRFHNDVLGCNWGDYLELVHNVPFWEMEMLKLNNHMGPFVSDPVLGKKYEYCLRAVDAMYACEDARDHINELLEVKTRSNGLMNMGIGAGPNLENMKENADKLAEHYDVLLEKFPEFRPKIEQSVGHGLATLRGKHKFEFSSQFRFFY